MGTGLVAVRTIGNMRSMLLGPQGVVDVFAMQRSAKTRLVMHVADFGAVQWSAIVDSSCCPAAAGDSRQASRGAG